MAKKRVTWKASWKFQGKGNSKTVNTAKEDIVADRLVSKGLSPVTKYFVDLAIEESADSLQKRVDQALYDIAAFMQRLIVRTPLDEDYKYENHTGFQYLGKNKNGKHKWKKVSGKYIKHKADDEVARENWTINFNGKKTIYITDAFRTLGHSSYLDKVNNEESIKRICNYLKRELKGLSIEDVTNITVENEVPYFDILEYGGYKKASGKIHEGKKKQHGVKNHHSVQAPYGMLRISLMELKDALINDKRDRTIGKWLARKGSLTDNKIRIVLDKLYDNNLLISKSREKPMNKVIAHFKNTSIKNIMNYIKVEDIQ